MPPNKYLYLLILFLAITLLLLAGEYRLVFANPRQINLNDDSTITNEGNDIHKLWLIAIREKQFLKGESSSCEGSFMDRLPK